MRKIIGGIAVAVILAGAPSWSFASRPLVTEDAGTAEKGTAELEIAFDHAREDNRDKYSIPSVQVAYGLTERIEIAAALPYIFFDPREGGRDDGVGDLHVYLKCRVWGEKDLFPAMTLKPFVKFPTADEDRGLGSGKTDFGLTAAFSKSFTGFNLHLDGTYVIHGERGVTDHLSLGFAGEFEIFRGFNFVSEVRYGNNFNSGRKDDPATLLGGIQAEFAGAVFDAALTLGLNGAAPDYLITVGVTLKFN